MNQNQRNSISIFAILSLWAISFEVLITLLDYTPSLHYLVTQDSLNGILFHYKLMTIIHLDSFKCILNFDKTRPSKSKIGGKLYKKLNYAVTLLVVEHWLS